MPTIVMNGERGAVTLREMTMRIRSSSKLSVAILVACTFMIVCDHALACSCDAADNDICPGCPGRIPPNAVKPFRIEARHDTGLSMSYPDEKKYRVKKTKRTTLRVRY